MAPRLSNSTSGLVGAVAPVTSSAILLIAKVPSKRSKTRLCEALRDSDRIDLASAMLKDAVDAVEGTVSLRRQENRGAVAKIAYYSLPGEAPLLRAIISSVQKGHKDSTPWELYPIPDVSAGLGVILPNGVDIARRVCGAGAVAVIGMDCPLLSTGDLDSAISYAQKGGSYIQPVEDGGYCLLSLPHHIPASAAFANIPWSSSTTCAAQIESITSQGVVVTNPGASRCSVGDGSDENGGISPHSRQDFFDVDTRHDLNKLEEEVFGRFFLGCRLVDIFGAANFEVVQGVGRWTVDFVRKRRVEHKRWFVRAGIAHLIWYALARKRH